LSYIAVSAINSSISKLSALNILSKFLVGFYFVSILSNSSLNFVVIFFKMFLVFSLLTDSLDMSDLSEEESLPAISFFYILAFLLAYNISFLYSSSFKIASSPNLFRVIECSYISLFVFGWISSISAFLFYKLNEPS
jgi:hypothetical protein